MFLSSTIWFTFGSAAIWGQADPVFFLNHCNVDRIWEAWMAQHGRAYAPQPGDGPAGHRLDNAMFTLFGETRNPADVLDPEQWYVYDSLTVD